jgi:hypothetical protein
LSNVGARIFKNRRKKERGEGVSLGTCVKMEKTRRLKKRVKGRGAEANAKERPDET